VDGHDGEAIHEDRALEGKSIGEKEKDFMVLTTNTSNVVPKVKTWYMKQRGAILQ
jgi:hypothetical protein